MPEKPLAKLEIALVATSPDAPSVEVEPDASLGRFPTQTGNHPDVRSCRSIFQPLPATSQSTRPIGAKLV